MTIVPSDAFFSETRESVDQPRRHFLGAAALAVAGLQLGASTAACAQGGGSTAAPPWRPQHTSFGPLKQINAGLLNVGYVDAGPPDGLAISIPTVTMESDDNGAPHPPPAAYAKKFTGRYAHRDIGGGCGHNLPQETPRAFAQAVIDVDAA